MTTRRTLSPAPQRPELDAMIEMAKTTSSGETIMDRDSITRLAEQAQRGELDSEALKQAAPVFARAVLDMDEATRWQPIETAPKDGTWFMIVCADDGDESVEIGCYDPVNFPKYELTEGGLYRKTEVLAWGWRGFNNFHRATHWQPLPPPPHQEDVTDG
jgi:hypothetical protein